MGLTYPQCQENLGSAAQINTVEKVAQKKGPLPKCVSIFKGHRSCKRYQGLALEIAEGAVTAVEMIPMTSQICIHACANDKKRWKILSLLGLQDPWSARFQPRLEQQVQVTKGAALTDNDFAMRIDASKMW